jgi:two-component system response regulator NreC
VITIVLADDHQIVRQGIRALLEKQPHFRIVAEAEDGLKAVRLVEELKPHVLILDLMMPGINGIEVTERVKKISPHTRVVILSMHSNVAYVAESLKNGADGYVLKGSSGNDLVQAVNEVTAGHRYLSAPLTERDLETYIEMSKTSKLDIYDALTTREREVLHMAAEGLSSAEIADRLSISPRTVEVHRANMMHKLGLNNQTELVRYAIQRGILPLDTG